MLSSFASSAQSLLIDKNTLAGIGTPDGSGYSVIETCLRPLAGLATQSVTLFLSTSC